MKVPVFLLVMTTAALAQQPCLRAHDRNDYNARPISLHEILAKNALGADHRSYRVATTCIHVDRSAVVALSSTTSCLALGDSVSTSTIDGHHETCRVTRVEPVTDDYATAKYKD